MAALAAHPYQSSACAFGCCCSLARAERSAQRDLGPVRPRRWRVGEAGSRTKQGNYTAFRSRTNPALLLADMRAKSTACPVSGRRGATTAGLKRSGHGLQRADIRASACTISALLCIYLASAGLSLPVIGALLGHTQAATTQRYAHLLDDPLRAATERVGAIVTAAGSRPPRLRR